MYKVFIGVFLLIFSEICGAFQDEISHLLKRFERYIVINNPNTLLTINQAHITFRQYVYDSLRQIISTVAGRKLLNDITDVYSQNIYIPNKGTLILRDVILPKNLCLFSDTELKGQITYTDISHIEKRNKALTGKIRFRLYKHMKFAVEGECCILIGSDNNYGILTPQNVTTTVVFSNGQVEAGIPRPIDVGIFHELLHCLHWVKDPVTVRRLSHYTTTKEENYRCRFIKPPHLLLQINPSWIEINNNTPKAANNILAISPYLFKSDLVTHEYDQDLDKTLQINIEELLTIRGKQKTTYTVSENSYRLQRNLPLRYGHAFDFLFEHEEGAARDESLYKEFLEIAKGG